MKLSEAIRAGAKIRPQAFGNFKQTDRPNWFARLLGHKPVETSCAFQAAVEAQGCDNETEEIVIDENASLLREGIGEELPPYGSKVSIPKYPESWKAVLGRYESCPQCADVAVGVGRVITHLNDDHRWTREAIALWIESLESKTHYAASDVVAVRGNVLDASEIG